VIGMFEMIITRIANTPISFISSHCLTLTFFLFESYVNERVD
jgi:hypothetical protein